MASQDKTVFKRYLGIYLKIIVPPMWLKTNFLTRMSPNNGYNLTGATNDNNIKFLK